MVYKPDIWKFYKNYSHFLLKHRLPKATFSVFVITAIYVETHGMSAEKICIFSIQLFIQVLKQNITIWLQAFEKMKKKRVQNE